MGLEAAGENGVMGEAVELGTVGVATAGLLVRESAGLNSADGAAAGVLSAGMPGHLHHRLELCSSANELVKNQQQNW